MNRDFFSKKQKNYVDQLESHLEFLLNEKEEKKPTLLEAMRYSVLNGGKRLRGILALTFCELFSKNSELALPAASAVEIFHAYTLVHDDLPCMDNDTLRRGKPSCWKAFGEANALLTGDALLTLSFEIISQTSKLSPILQLKQCQELSRAGGYKGVIEGQVLDLWAESHEISFEQMKNIHALKTGRLIESAILMGAIAANTSDENQKKSREYGKHLGLQFQIVDDLLDVIGEEKWIGKPVGSDQENHKTTYVTLFGVEKAKQLAYEETEKALMILTEFSEDTSFLEELTRSMLYRIQ